MATLQATKDYFVEFDYYVRDYTIDGFEGDATLSAIGNRIQARFAAYRTHRVQKETRLYAVPQESRVHKVQTETRVFRIQEGEE